MRLRDVVGSLFWFLTRLRTCTPLLRLVEIKSQKESCREIIVLMRTLVAERNRT
jgi:hypothetical protein